MLAQMLTSSSISGYPLGSTDAEQERLIRQAARLEALTERFFCDAGISPGQRVLDIGSGVGDVAMLAARLVGPSGEVVGIERDSRSITRAGARATEAGLHNVNFIQCDVHEVLNDKPFDAVVGRLILMFLSDPVAALRSFFRLVRPGGVLAFQEQSWATCFSALATSTSLVSGRFSTLRDLTALRSKPRHGARSLSGIPAGGAACSNCAHGSAAR
jgi:ubiquinone/menaquinone biosynthesis C-methylase UbiE